MLCYSPPQQPPRHHAPALYPHPLATTSSDTWFLLVPGLISSTSSHTQIIHHIQAHPAAAARLRIDSWDQHPCTHFPPQPQILVASGLKNSVFASQPVKEADGDDELSIHTEKEPSCLLNMFQTSAGSVVYKPPEQLLSEIPLASPFLEIWVLGCVLYGLLQGHLPFEDNFEPRLRLKIMNSQFEFPGALVVTPADKSWREAEKKKVVAKLVQGCLAVDRDSLWVVLEIGCSPWLDRAPPPHPRQTGSMIFLSILCKQKV
ncbi:hypothetical protein PtB15_10B527 [Puccinia triticina]|nr:hypothetical protein PtB15_10B527 [Puccinia triticina]